MTEPLDSATSSRKRSPSGIASLILGLLSNAIVLILGMVFVGGARPGPGAAIVLSLAPLVLALAGLALCIIAIIGRRRLWWLSLIALPLNLLQLAPLARVIYGRL